MRFKYLFFLFLLTSFSPSFAQKWTKPTTTTTNYAATVARPKLVVGMVIDQMRWDYLYRFYSRYSKGGFKRLINEGFSAENTFIPYTPTYTACGHSSIYTGSVPAINGIIGNNWYDPEQNRDVYCTEDKAVKTVGSTSRAGEMSPKNMLVTTITDELRLATNFKSKVIGISQKDRGSILPAGHTANASYWYDGGTGNWITSTFYMQTLPKWVSDYNDKKEVNKYYANDWKTLYPIETYTQSTADDKSYEGKFKGEATSAFPHLLTNYAGKNYSLITSTPYGNTMTFEMSKLAIQQEKLGQTGNTDFLAVSCSSTDYVGHQFGPNSIEIEDTYLRLDKDLEDFFTYLDKTLGKGNYLFFLSADHAVAHVPGFMAENKLPGGLVSSSAIRKGLDTLMNKKFNLSKSVITVMNNQVYFDHTVIDNKKVDFAQVKQTAIDYLKKQDGVADAVDLQILNTSTIPQEIRERITNGYNARRSGDVYFLLKSNWFDGSATGTTHGAWYPYDSHIPLVFMGWKVKPGKTNQTHYMTDIAATLAAMLQIQMPSGSVGSPITELTHQ
ncbi:alkaline phosphatase family protein [Pedobacter sp. LMG 31464]|uniref:Alkaline phosphatase family protein n=1 Tax=Pedobacter planticolens TaxID=2679964 RepID=A0A923DWZ8_9SPHI|nr:alkaline phosphatase PafA [Pedobacter planticolens]MBB2145551.1 alkaline phosphatase family protein [Pedobacter planticolens]